jgi:hypothetical protein
MHQRKRMRQKERGGKRGRKEGRRRKGEKEGGRRKGEREDHIVLWYLQIHCYHRRLTVPLLGDLWEVSWMR